MKNMTVAIVRTAAIVDVEWLIEKSHLFINKTCFHIGTRRMKWNLRKKSESEEDIEKKKAVEASEPDDDEIIQEPESEISECESEEQDWDEIWVASDDSIERDKMSSFQIMEFEGSCDVSYDDCAPSEVLGVDPEDFIVREYRGNGSRNLSLNSIRAIVPYFEIDDSWSKSKLEKEYPKGGFRNIDDIRGYFDRLCLVVEFDRLSSDFVESNELPILTSLILVSDDERDRLIYDAIESLPLSSARNHILGFMKIAGLGTELDLQTAYVLLKDSENGRHLASAMLGLNMVDDPDMNESPLMSQLGTVSIELMKLHEIIRNDENPEKLIAYVKRICKECEHFDECVQELVFTQLLKTMRTMGSLAQKANIEYSMYYSRPFNSAFYRKRMIEEYDGSLSQDNNDLFRLRTNMLSDPRFILMFPKTLQTLNDDDEQGLILDSMMRSMDWSGDTIMFLSRLIDPDDAGSERSAIVERFERIADVCTVRLVTRSVDIGI